VENIWASCIVNDGLINTNYKFPGLRYLSDDHWAVYFWNVFHNFTSKNKCKPRAPEISCPINIFWFIYVACFLSQWARGLRRGATVACWVCGFESRRWHKYLFIVSVVGCQVEVPASGWSLVQRSPTECGVSECDHKVSIMRQRCFTRSCRAIKKFLPVVLLAGEH